MNIGRAVRFLREERKLTQDELAARAGVTQATISALEIGNQDYSAALLDGLAKAFGVRISEIFVLAEQQIGLPMPDGFYTQDENIVVEHYRAMNPGSKYHYKEIGAALTQPGEPKKAG